MTTAKYLIGLALPVAVGLILLSWFTKGGSAATLEISDGAESVQGFLGESVFLDCRLVNESGGPLTVARISPSCPCAELDARLAFPIALAPGESKPFQVRVRVLDPRDLALAFEFEAATSDGETVKGGDRIEIVCIRRAHAIPFGIAFGKVETQEEVEGKTLIYGPRSLAPAKIDEVSAAPTGLVASFTPASELPEPDQAYEREEFDLLGVLTVRCDPKSAPAKLSGSVTLQFNDGHELFVPVTGWFEQ